MAAVRLLLAAALLVAGSPQAGADAPAAGKQGQAREGVCSFSAFSSDHDPAGLNVRSGPSATAPVVGRLPAPEQDRENDRSYPVTFDVVEARNGWFRVVNAERWEPDRPSNPPLASGWISGRFVDFSLQTDRAFERPDPRSRIIAYSWRAGDEMRTFSWRLPSSCRGEWVRLLVRGRDRVERPAWVRGICGNPETSCDGVRGDNVPYDELPRR